MSPNSLLDSMEIYKIISDYLLAIVTFFGVLAIVYQVKKGYDNSLSLQQKNFKDRIRHEIFSELSDGLSDCIETYEKLGSDIFLMPGKFSFYLEKDRLGLGPDYIDVRVPKINQMSLSANKSFVNLIYLIERYEIMLPAITTARLVMHEHLFTMSRLHNKFLNFAGNYIPVDVPEDKVAKVGNSTLVRKEIDEKAIEEMRILGKEYYGSIIDMISYMYDLRVIMQNVLLGHLFKKEVKGRTLSPSRNYIVLKSDDDPNMQEIKKEMLKNGSWGKALQRHHHGLNLT